MKEQIKYLSFLIPLILLGFNKNFGQNPGNIPVINSHVTSGLLLHLDAGNSSSYSGSGNTWNDLSPSGNNGIINGATFNSSNKSFDFDGSNDYVGLNAVLSQGQNVYTIEGYFKPDTQQTDVIFEQVQAGGGQHTRAAMMTISDGYGGFNGWANDFHDNTPVKIGDWNYWTITVDKNVGSNQVKVYVNGILQSQGNTNNGANNLNVGTGSTNIGSRLSGVAEFFDGEIKTIKVYNRALSAAEVKQNYWATINPNIITDGLIIYLDGDNLNSFDGGGSIWRDLSGNNYDFYINENGFQNINGIKYMDIEGSYGGPVRVDNNSGQNVSTYPNATAQVFSTINNSTADWRTLLRGIANDHPVLIQSGTNNLGYFENGGANFVDSGFDVNTIPDYTTQFNFLNFHFADTSPYWEFSYNDKPIQAQITSSSASYQNGFYVLGKADVGANTDVSRGGQWWGQIGVFLYYSRKLTEAETKQNFNAFASRFGLESIPKIERAQISLDNSTVSVTFSDTVYGGTANATSTLEVSDFSLTISGGSASLSSATPSSINVSGTTIGLEVPLTGTPDGKEILTITPVNNSIFSVSGDTVSSTQSSNTVQLISNIVTSGLVLYLDATNQNSYSGSGTKWYDLTGNQNNGTINGATYISNDGGSFSFDGSNDYISITDNSTLDITGDITISYSVDLNGAPTWSPFITKGVIGDFNYSTWVGADYGIDIDNGSTGSTIKPLYVSSSEIKNGKFSKITISINSSSGNIKTYVDGILTNTRSGTLGSVNNSDLVIGKHNNNNYHGAGKIGQLLIYNSALTDQQVYQNYDALIDIPPTDISLTSNTISETASIGSLIGTLSATDSDTSISSLTFSFTSSGDTQDDDNGSFTISGTSLLTSTTLDYETKTSYNIYINVSDGTSNYAKAFTVSVTNILEPVTDLGFEVASIVTDGLVLHLDAANSNSYSGSGNTWYDISGNNYNGILIVIIICISIVPYTILITINPLGSI
ncbi:cadherin domain-containing protein [Flavobacteriaceae bacterium]|nr:cadherin domain-containing protein [Flavobacteriaceae bacterium]